MWAILLVIAGIVLTANSGWFAGAATVGAFCFWIGAIILAFYALILLLTILGIIGGAASSRSRRRRSRW